MVSKIEQSLLLLAARGRYIRLFMLLCSLAATPSAYAQLDASLSAPTSVTLNWTASGDDGAAGTASSYDIRYATTLINDANWASATQVSGEPLPKAAGQAESFTVSGLTPSTSYYFAIKALDEAGNASPLSNVVQKSTTAEITPPSAVANLAVSSPQPTSLTVTWTAPGDDGAVGTATTYDLRYSTSVINDANFASASAVSGEPAPKASGQSESMTITGLSPSITYYFALKTADEIPNWSAISNIASGTTTSENVAPAAIANLSLSGATSNSIALNWTAPGDDGAVGTATSYDIRYSTSAITSGNWASASQVSGEPSPQLAGTGQSMTVSGLTPSTTYFFAIRTSDEVPNQSALSNVPSLSTASETTPPDAVSNLLATASTNSSVTLGWNAPGDDGASGTAASYDIRYSTAVINDANWNAASQVAGEPAPKGSGQSESFVVPGLQAGVTYYFAIKTADEVPNWSSLSNITSRNTSSESNPPASIANLAATASTSNSITITWSAPGDDGAVGTASSYDIRYSTSTITEGNWNAAFQATGEPAPQASGQNESFVLTGLGSNTTYFIAIKTADEVPNLSAISNVVSRSTATETVAPSAVSNLAVSSPTQSSLTLNWTAVGDDGALGTASSYDIRYSTATITSANWNSATQVAGEPNPKAAGQSESMVITGLSLSTQYFFAIKVSDEVPNQSALSNVASGTTTADQTPPSPIQDLSALTGSFVGEILLGWTAVGDDSTAGRATAYQIRYSTSPITSGNFNSAGLWPNPPSPFQAGTPQAIVMQGLQPGVRYYTAVKVFDEQANESVMSNVTSAVASFNIGTDANGQVALLSPESGAALSTARPKLVIDNEGAGPLTTYFFDLATDSNFFGLIESKTVAIESGNSTGWQIENPLAASNTYYWRVRSDSLAYSNTRSFTVAPESHVYPNPYNLNMHASVTFKEIPSGADLVVTSASGELIRQWNDIGLGEIAWDGRNESGESVASGVYLWYLPESGAKGKLILVR